MNTEKAIDILMEESGRGLLDRNLVQVYTDAKVFQAIDSKEYSTAKEFSSFSNHPCDVDEHLHDKAGLK